MTTILSEIEFHALLCLARRAQGSPSFYKNDSNVEIWYKHSGLKYDTYPNQFSHDDFGLCLICNQDVSAKYAIVHARKHIKDHGLTAFL